MQLNDQASDEERQQLLPFVTRLACADTPEIEHQRAASIVGGKNAPGERRLSFISFWVIDLLLCDGSKSAAFHRFCALSF